MKKIITVGHPQSGFEQIHALLLASGMAPAEPSQRDQYTAQHITATLLKAHGALPLAKVVGDDPLPQIEVAPVWQGMVLDLMLANLKHPLWGWADTQAVQLLEYWKTQDPQMVFVLVYDAPQTTLARLSLQDASAPITTVQQRLKTWVAYNSALLQFYLRNPQRCVLVHATQGEPSASSYLQLINSRIDAPSQASTATPAQETAPTQALALPGLSAIHEISITPDDDWTASQQAHMLLAHLLQTYPQAQALYEELQAVATMPRNTPVQWAWNDDAHSRFMAWQEFVQLHQRIQAAETSLRQKQELFTQQQQALQADFATKNQLETAPQTTQAATSATTELQEENELLLIQLHQVQEELERYYLENQRLKAGVTKPQAKSGQQASSANHYGAADRIKRQLSYRLGSVMIEKSRTLGGWLSMPFALQAEAKRFHQEKAARKGEKLPPIAHYRDAHEAERVKQHLSYRLGSTLVQRSGSLGGWLSMPCALRSQVKEFQKSRR